MGISMRDSGGETSKRVMDATYGAMATSSSESGAAVLSPAEGFSSGLMDIVMKVGGRMASPKGVAYSPGPMAAAILVAGVKTP
ncbi:hypothetical protein KSP40_PGU001235 [Platanthera guangdongensis]